MSAAPSSPSSDNAGGDDQLQKAARDNLKRLDAQRRALEAEAAAIVDELLAPPADDAAGEPMGVDTPLVDADGYPRGDVDVFRARTLRHRLNEVRTDHKDLMKRVEAGMVQVAAFGRRDAAAADEEERRRRAAPKPQPKFDPKTGKWAVQNWDGTVAGVEHGEDRRFDRIGRPDDVLPGEEAGGAGGAAPSALALASASASAGQQPPLVPFALVDGVSPDSPAAEAGLVEGDLLLRFGPVHHLNHRDLRAVLELVPTAAANQDEVAITLLRREQPSVEPGWTHPADEAAAERRRRRMIVKIRPRPWSGRGLLGCHIKAYDDAQLDTTDDVGGH
mmetsp:Transcript_4655/g.13162  ORF Transcript_4655/g.13162 Transcript_4655/m.13162 type:complete len:333 (-) Transcript_4655:1018-2016(-)|eukprot:CAMPEP_0181030762 /NCGR_PEP_ID=MMETSP1070-20121207/5889_1 /TAXON_ID=265543 /ORGANISM="Minutocellus polymorphus, Strain NH13" /LENGTH=332 /DNA_ID=CAMNT_0023108129 /DNA_START=88 /DNA_END=1086 /DNA_ORIENTATION=-